MRSVDMTKRLFEALWLSIIISCFPVQLELNIVILQSIR